MIKPEKLNIHFESSEESLTNIRNQKKNRISGCEDKLEDLDKMNKKYEKIKGIVKDHAGNLRYY